MRRLLFLLFLVFVLALVVSRIAAFSIDEGFTRHLSGMVAALALMIGTLIVMRTVDTSRTRGTVYIVLAGGVLTLFSELVYLAEAQFVQQETDLADALAIVEALMLSLGLLLIVGVVNLALYDLSREGMLLAGKDSSILNHQRILLELTNLNERDSYNLSKVASETCRNGASALEVQRASVWFIDDSKALMEFLVLYDHCAEEFVGADRIELSQYPNYAEALKENRTIDADDALDDPRTRDLADSYLRPLGITSMLDAPIRLGTDAVGVVCFEHIGEARHWNPEEVAFAADLANVLSGVLHDDQSRRSHARIEEKRKLESVGAVAAGVAHDFNNVLQVINSHAELAQLSSEDEKSEVVDSLEEVKSAVDRGSRLVGEILQFSRGEESPKSALNLNDFVEKTMRAVEPTVEAGITLRYSVCKEQVSVVADHAQLEAVLINLIGNASSALQGSGVIQVELRSESSSIYAPLPSKLLRPGRHALITIEDNGSGINDEVLGCIFEPFFTTKEKGEGTGLGLATSLQTIRACRGDIGVESKVGEFTRFTVYLPVAT